MYDSIKLNQYHRLLNYMMIMIVKTLFTQCGSKKKEIKME